MAAEYFFSDKDVLLLFGRWVGPCIRNTTASFASFTPRKMETVDVGGGDGGGGDGGVGAGGLEGRVTAIS